MKVVESFALEAGGNDGRLNELMHIVYGGTLFALFAGEPKYSAMAGNERKKMSR